MLVERLSLVLPTPHSVDAHVGADSNQPGFEWPVRVEVSYGAESLDQGFLNRVVRILRVAQHAHCDLTQHRSVRLRYELKGIRLASFCSLDELALTAGDRLEFHLVFLLFTSPVLYLKML